MEDQQWLEAIEARHEAEVATLKDLLTGERSRSARLEAECRNLWAAFALSRGAAERAVGVMGRLEDDGSTPDGDDYDPLHAILQRADRQLGIVPLTEGR